MSIPGLRTVTAETKQVFTIRIDLVARLATNVRRLRHERQWTQAHGAPAPREGGQLRHGRTGLKGYHARMDTCEISASFPSWTWSGRSRR